MAVGDSALFAGMSYIAVGRETTLGTAVTASSALICNSFGLTTNQEGKILEEITRSRNYQSRIQQGKKVGGPTEYYFRPDDNASTFILQNAMGGTITSATGTSETAGGLAFTHTFNLGHMGSGYSSLTVNCRRGPSTGGKVFQYNGVRVNELTFTAEIDDALKTSVDFIGIDSTVGATDVESLLTITSADVLNFTRGRFSIENSFNSLTSTSFWHVQSMELKIMNNLKSDNESRRIGSDILSVLPVGVQTFELKCNIRFDTTTAFDSMIAATKLSCELEFTGPTLTGSALRSGIKFQFPEVYVNTASEPEIGGPDEVLTSEVTFHVLRDDTTSTGYAMRALVTNLKANYT